MTNDVNRRFVEHSSSRHRLGNAIRKYASEIELVTVFSFESLERALQMERELRPKQRIGWNIAIGGQVPPNNSNNESVKQKISATLKRIGAIPYCKKTHSPETIAKALHTKKIANRRMYHDPVSGNYAFIALGLGEQIPHGWIPGRIHRITSPKLVRGIDFDCHVKSWIVTAPSGVRHHIKNLKRWCRENDMNYWSLAANNHRWHGWEAERAK